MDTQIARALGSLLPATGLVTRPPAGDWRTRRVILQRTFDRVAAKQLPVNRVKVDRYATTAIDGTRLPLLLYSSTDNGRPVSAALFLHGGGMIMGWHRIYDLLAHAYVASSGVSLLSVDYRVAPEHPYLIPVQDCYAGLVWLADHATDLGIDPARIAVMGGSAGGGLAAGVTLLARDQGGPQLAQQLLFYPMLDDRTTISDPRLQPFLTWDYEDNATGWQSLLGDRAGSHDVSPYVAPARVEDLADLPPAYIDVGGLDIFCDETLLYARRLMAAGVPTEFHLHPGAPHAFEILAPTTGVAQRVVNDRVRRLKSL